MNDQAQKIAELVAANQEIKEKLESVAQRCASCGNGDEREIFDREIAPVFSEAGLEITFDEFREAFSDCTELSEKELDDVNAGFLPLIILGITASIKLGSSIAGLALYCKKKKK